MTAKQDVVVIGGGVIGLSVAYYLTRAGRDVTVLDDEARGGASMRNAGMIVPSHVIPLAAPGILAKGLQWMMRPDSPFHVRPRLDADLAAWLRTFWASCTPEHVARAVPVLRDLSLSSVALFEEMAASDDFADFCYENTGLLMVYRTEKGGEEARDEAEVAAKAGLDVSVLCREETIALDPGLRAPLLGSVLYRQDGRVDPTRFMHSLTRWLEHHGAQIRNGVQVVDFEVRNGTVRRVMTTESDIAPDAIVLAAGAWSAGLAKKLGVPLSLQPAKGFSISIPRNDRAPVIPHILIEDKLTVTPMPDQIRFAGTLALSGFDEAVSRRRTASLRKLAALYSDGEYSDGQTGNEEIWFGYRPCSSDGLPFLGRPAGLANAVIATGHGMLGVTLAPITGRLVTDILDGRTSEIELAALSPDR